jgi:Tol biopolymer transport system component
MGRPAERRRPGRKALVRAAVGLLLTVLAGCVAPERTAARAGWVPPTELPRSAALARTRLAFDSDRTGNFELFAAATDGTGAVQLTGDRTYDSWGPRISPDRETVLFSRSPAGVHDRDPALTSLWAIAASGGAPVELRPAGLDGWGLQGHAEWAPDGRSLVMVGGPRANAQIFVTDGLGQQPRAVTDRPGTNIDPRFAPNGTEILFVGCPQAICTPASYEVYEVPAAGGQPRRLTDDRLPDYDPTYSPDGRRLAWLTNLSGGVQGVWDIRVREPDGRVRRLVGDRGITSRPQFSADGRFVFTHRLPPGGNRFDLFRIRVDGSGLTNLTAGQPGNNEYPAP